MDKQAIINELTRFFINDSSLNKLLKSSNQDNLLAMYQALFNLWNRTLTAALVYQKQALVLTFSQAIFVGILENRQSLNKRIIEITTLLLSLSNDEKAFRKLFKKEFKRTLPHLTALFNQNYEDNKRILRKIGFVPKAGSTDVYKHAEPWKKSCDSL